MSNTICAISTPYGSGGIAVVRVSGEQSIAIVGSLFRGRTDLREAKANTAHYGEIVRGGEVLDEVVATVFRAPHSFTGEDTVEISCHGSTFIQQELLRWLVDAGCRLAKAGEFTQRAFLNGKMDLAEAEAVADLIASQSKAEKDLALKQLKGSVSSEIAVLRDRLLRFTSLVELELDFADHEELEFADRGELKALAEEIHGRLSDLTRSFQAGNAIKRGIAVALIGETNVGKSTLLNALVGEERAIVSDIAGTTRDTIEDTLVLDGILYRFIDTAGLRETEDEIERLGIARSRQAAEEAQIVIEIQGATDQQDPPRPSLQREGEGRGSYIRVVNKADLLPAVPTTSEDIENTEAPIYISAKNKQIAPLLARLKAIGSQLTATRNAATISNIRHYEALTQADEAIQRVQEGLAAGVSGEFLSMDLHDCLNALGEVTGQITSDEVLHSIFSHFCIGK
ncbi:MAG: tRNA uridine-5-carboxymethylaminomethyl(34) synthesis GTPase MnmE [Paludibacteraceae bacterium]|nr:tRNA uridine-5-carboxymethylaminomethyl(34) synthesis GTPase MnmE [Paludibacteraceae bacterium]